ncbi:MAG: hypothetical protein COC19_03135, partial [SAR86 cluster bacterium]
MNKKLLQTAIAAAAVTAGSGAFAAVSSTNVDGDANVPLVTAGATTVFDGAKVVGAIGDIEIGGTVSFLLPSGLNFEGTPVVTSTGAIQLAINASDDPGTNGLVTLSDTNADGKMDRAEVKVVATSTATTDAVTLTGSLINGTATSGAIVIGTFVRDDADLIVDAIGAVTVATATTAAKVAGPIAAQLSTPLVIPNTDVTGGIAAASAFLITVPAGVGGAGNETLTFTLSEGLEIDGSTTFTIVALTDGAPAIAGFAAVNEASSFSVDLASATTAEAQ